MRKSERFAGPAIVLRGANENNLKNVTVSIPVGLMTCLTGVSGSGKSSLLDECLMAEASRRHQVLSRSTRQVSTPFSPHLEEAKVPFVVAVRQGILQWNSRSTIATATGLLQRLRDVVVNHGQVRSANGPLAPLRAEDVAAWCRSHHAGANVLVLAALERRVLGPLWPYIEKAIRLHPELLVCVVETGTHPTSEGEPPEKYRRTTTKTHRDIYAIVGKALAVRQDSAVSERIALAMKLARKPDDICLLLEGRTGSSSLQFESSLIDPSDAKIYWLPTPSLLSFNSRLPRSGRCTTCDGLGSVERISETSLIADPTLPLAEGGLAIPFETASSRYRYFPPLAEEIRGLFVAHDLPITSSWKDLGETARREFLEGSGDRTIQPRKPDGDSKGKRKPFIGMIDRIRAKFAGKDAGATALAGLQQTGSCPDCNGTRLNHPARSVFFGGKSFSAILALTLSEAGRWLRETGRKLSDSHASRILGSLALLCDSCDRLGLGHLAWSRPIDTLSGGEAQRLRISASMSARLQGGCYALDEPTRGLHAADAALLCGTLRDLVDNETTVLLVEHNPVVVAGADHVIEMGPGGGSEGGKVIYAGPPAGSPLLSIKVSKPPHRTFAKSGHVELKGIQFRNIHDEDVSIPLGGVVCVTGVSGSGKSTLIRDVLTPAVQSWIDAGTTSGENFRRLTIKGKIDRLVYVSQNALSSNPRSLLLTFLGLADDFRMWFHRHSDAVTLGLYPSHFSPNGELGQCPACEGLGRVTQNAGVGVTVCPACGGTRFHPHVLFAKYRGQSVGEWLSSDLSLLAECEEAPSQVRSAAQLGKELGIGHLSLGRSLPTLSGGECQRLRIVKALLECQSAEGNESLHQVFVMDEPAAGLHPSDVDRLNQALHRVVLGGRNTLILVEHNLSIIRLADWVVDVGPLSADQGGRILFAGTVDDFLLNGPNESKTRQALQSELPTPPRRTRPLSDEALSLAYRSSAESIQVFREYLALSNGELDADENPTPAKPAYLVSAGSNDAHADHDVFGLLSLALPMCQLYAAESNFTGHTVFPDGKTACEAALAALRAKKGMIAGWFPLTSLAAEETVTWPETRQAIKDGITRGAFGWFDGADVQRKAPVGVQEPKESHLVRLLVDPSLDTAEAVNRAFALGEGWVSIIDPSRGRLDDFSIRVLKIPELRVGSRWRLPQIFDPGIQHTACRLCKGGGTVEGIDEKLVVADRHSGIRQDKLLTKQALEAIRAARRRQMMPAVDRLANVGLVDLTLPLDKMAPDTLIAFWFGYPEKSFLSAGGDEKRKGDWYQWLGLVNYVTANMWKAPDRNWANQLNESRHPEPCPRCGGTGLGWEARLRDVQGVTLQTILSEWTVDRLTAWLSRLVCHTTAGKKATANANARLDLARRLRLGKIKCGASYSELPAHDRLRLFTLACSYNQLLGAIAFVQPVTHGEVDSTEQLIKEVKEQGNMQWVVEP